MLRLSQSMNMIHPASASRRGETPISESEAHPQTAADFRPLKPAAKRILTPKAWSYYSAGATDELSECIRNRSLSQG